MVKAIIYYIHGVAIDTFDLHSGCFHFKFIVNSVTQEKLIR